MHRGLSTLLALIVLFGAPLGPAAQNAASRPESSDTSFTYPKERRGEIARAFIDAFNSGDENRMRDFHYSFGADATTNSETVEDAVWQNQRLHKLLGALVPYRLARSDDSTLVLLARSDTLKSWFHVGFELSRTEPAQVMGQFIRPAPRPDDSSDEIPKPKVGG